MTIDKLYVDVLRTDRLRFFDGAPVRAASAIARLGDGWLVTQDDANNSAWHRPGQGITRIRLFAPTEGLDYFADADGTKHLKPDIEVACPVRTGAGSPATLLLGSGSSPRRMRGAIVSAPYGSLDPAVVSADLTPLYRRFAQVLGIDPAALNIEGAAVDDGQLFLFNRGIPAAAVPSQSAVIDVESFMDAWQMPQRLNTLAIAVGSVYNLGSVNGVGLALTDAVAVGPGLFLMSAAAEDTPNAVDDGAVVGSALVLADSVGVLAVTTLPLVNGVVAKIEGLAVVDETPHHGGLTVLAVVDADDTRQPSIQLTLAVRW